MSEMCILFFQIVYYELLILLPCCHIAELYHPLDNSETPFEVKYMLFS